MPMERAARCLVSNGICFRRTEARPISCARGLPIGIMESGTAAHQCSPFSTTPVQEECEVGDYLSEVCLSLSRSSSFSLSSRSASLNSSSASAHQDIALEDCKCMHGLPSIRYTAEAEISFWNLFSPSYSKTFLD
eukprot:scpid104979/ scgid0844/ 